jgi:hypothetical protein
MGANKTVGQIKPLFFLHYRRTAGVATFDSRSSSSFDTDEPKLADSQEG